MWELVSFPSSQAGEEKGQGSVGCGPLLAPDGGDLECGVDGGALGPKGLGMTASLSSPSAGRDWKLVAFSASLAVHSIGPGSELAASLAGLQGTGRAGPASFAEHVSKSQSLSPLINLQAGD